MQASLPVIGLLSRLAAPSGGVGNDMTAYPEVSWVGACYALGTL